MACNPVMWVSDFLKNAGVAIRAIWQRISINKCDHIALARQVVKLGLILGGGHAKERIPSWACELLKQAGEEHLVVRSVPAEVDETITLRGQRIEESLKLCAGESMPGLPISSSHYGC